MVVDVNAPVEIPTALLVACAPLHPPEAVHVVASVLLQVSVDVPPLTILAGVAVSITVGAGAAGVTATVALAAAEPPAPEQLKMKLVVAVNAPVEIPTTLLVDCGPLQPPEAVHVVASVLLQVSVDVPPLTILAGVALRLTVGFAGDPSAFSPEPLQAPKRSTKPTNKPVRRFLAETNAIDIIARRGNLHASRDSDSYASIFACASCHYRIAYPGRSE
ncbi:MAG: hypothetical protein RLN69_16305 [Woeseiaceae bacterium]